MLVDLRVRVVSPVLFGLSDEEKPELKQEVKAKESTDSKNAEPKLFTLLLSDFSLRF